MYTMKKKISVEHLHQACKDLIDLFKLAGEDHTELAVQISATISDGMVRVAYCKDAKSSMILEHIVARDLQEIKDRNEDIYS